MNHNRRRWIFTATVFVRHPDGTESVADMMQCYSVYTLRAIVRKVWTRTGDASRVTWSRTRRGVQ